MPKRIMTKLAGTLATLLLLTAMAACDSAPHAYLEGDPKAFPRLRLEDGAISLNDRCPVRKNKLSRGFDPLLVNGKPIGFC